MTEPLIIFKPTGETRCPKKGEWYLYNRFEEIRLQAFALGGVSGVYPIYERIAVEVPEGAIALTPFFDLGCLKSVSTERISLSRPKEKKWIWEREWGIRFVMRTLKPESEKEIENDDDIWHKVPCSEVEE